MNTATLLLVVACVGLSVGACDLDTGGSSLADGGKYLGGYTCGNGQIDIGEECDGDKFLVKTCLKGKLVCKPNCTLDTKACTEYCGDLKLSEKEECDVLPYKTEFKVSCLKGKQTCRDDCTVDRSKCEAWCGDGKILAGIEACDGKNIPAKVCHNGTVSCDPFDCSVDFRKCEEFCGDEVINGNEECDRTEFWFKCHDPAGQLRCRPDCTLDVSSCSKYCGDGVLNHLHEDCDGKVFREPKPCALATCGKWTCQVDPSKCP